MKAKVGENGGGEKMKVTGQRKGRKEGKNEGNEGEKNLGEAELIMATSAPQPSEDAVCNEDGRQSLYTLNSLRRV